MTRQRPIGVTILAVLAGLAAVMAILYALQIAGITIFGRVDFFPRGLIGILMWGLLAAIWIWVVRMLWNVDPQGWYFLVILSSLNLILGVVNGITGTPWQWLAPSLLFNAIILVYCLLPGTKDAFGTG